MCRVLLRWLSGYGPARSHELRALSVGADVVHLYGPGGPGVVAVACGQEDRGDVYVRAAWFDLRGGRGRAEEVETGASLGYGGDLCGYPVSVEVVPCAALGLCLWLAGGVVLTCPALLCVGLSSDRR